MTERAFNKVIRLTRRPRPASPGATEAALIGSRLGGRPFRSPNGLPASRERRSAGAVVSIAMHAFVLIAMLGPALWASSDAITRLELGAGGAGPVGGGGGGTRGTGGWQESAVERLTYVTPPRPAPAAPTPVAEVPKPVVVPPPVVRPPAPVPKPAPEIPPVTPPSTAEATVTVAPPSGSTVASTSGTGGGTGTDGTGGNGPGSGGGVGSGIGTGRGSGVGPGTGGGNQVNYPPTPTEMFLPPFPVPNRVKGFHLIAEFEVDETGRVLEMQFNETRDGDYNRKLRDILRAIRFRPGTRPDGTPVRMKTQIEYSF